MPQITLSELPETIQSFVNQAQKTGETLTIIQDGIPCAVIAPIQKKNRAAFGVMVDSGQVLGDIVSPTLNLADWDALSHIPRFGEG